MGLACLVSRFAKRPALAQEIPALIEFDLDGRQPIAFGGVERPLFKKPVLFGDEVLNVFQYRSIVSLVCHVISFRLGTDGPRLR